MQSKKNIVPIKSTVFEDDEPIFYSTKDLTRILQCSEPTARSIMLRDDFPLIKVGKNFKVSKKAFEKWAMERRD